MPLPSAIDYLTHPTHYLTTAASHDLAPTGVSCPPVRSYLPTLVDFMRRHPHVSPDTMS